MKFITLLSAAYVGGVLRHPHEGSIPVSDADAKRLVQDEKLAEDVTDGFAQDFEIQFSTSRADPALPA